MTDPGLHASLTRDRYVPVAFPYDASKLQEAAAAFLDFLALPLAVKRELHVPATVHRASADGYTDKLYMEAPGKDRKEFFHFRPFLLRRPEYRAAAQTYPAVPRFLAEAAELFAAAEATAHKLFAEQFPDLVSRIFDEEGKTPQSVLRFLSYAPQVGTGFCAQAHYDKGFATLALAESAPGLRIGSGSDAALVPVEHTSGKALFMPAILMEEETDGKVGAAWHDVIHAEHEPPVNDICARWAMVFFLNSREARFHEWHEVHTPHRA